MIIYIHGFNSSGQSSKADALRAMFPEQDVIAPDLPWQPKQAIALLEDLLESNREQTAVHLSILFMGGSMTNIFQDYLLKGLDTKKSLDDFAAGKIQSIFENPDTHSRFFIEEMCSGINGNRDKYAACRKDVFADMIRYEGCLKDKSLKVIIISFCARFGFYDLLERIAESYDLSGSYCRMDIPLVECIESKRIDSKTKLKTMNVLLAHNCTGHYSDRSIEFFRNEFSK